MRKDQMDRFHRGISCLQIPNQISRHIAQHLASKYKIPNSSNIAAYLYTHKKLHVHKK